MEVSDGFFTGPGATAVDEAYRPLPALYLGFLAIWFVTAFSWTFNTWSKRHFQPNNLQWALASIPSIKVLQLALSFLFWFSCFNLQICSLWMSFGVFVTGVLFQTASFVSFLLISHGYCIMCERLSVSERRTTAALGCALYLTLIGYKASIPYFTVLMLFNYFISFYVIFRHTARNLLVLREQLSFVEDEDVQEMHDAMHTKYTMFKKFQGAMQIIAAAEIMIYMNVDGTTDNYWLWLLVREWAQFCIFLYIGWIFRSQEVSPQFSVMPTLKSKVERKAPPIYSIEMDAADFKDLASHEWHIGVPTSCPSTRVENSADHFLIIVQHPHASSRAVSGGPIGPNVAASGAKATATVATTDSCSRSGHVVQRFQSN
ncbi:uncharacterized protein LOC131222983 [Magnolia sinica]|uniref:uncharacterized protein LOC131222983 n=1 Tax=Magnolia sinica TaxID=86752 RepID=UPI002658F627|nr:uncharacterized protein LOC131222983 [Magnolia sinica]